MILATVPPILRNDTLLGGKGMHTVAFQNPSERTMIDFRTTSNKWQSKTQI